MSPQKTKDGKPYGPLKYKELVKECYILSKNLNTSYTDILKITPTEKRYLIQFLMEEAQQRKDMIEKAKAEREMNNQANNRNGFSSRMY